MLMRMHVVLCHFEKQAFPALGGNADSIQASLLRAQLVLGSVTRCVEHANALELGCLWHVQIKAGTWEGGHNKKATQYFNVIGYLVNRWVGYFVMLITIISLCSTGIAQVVAISTGLYYLDIHVTKRSVIASNPAVQPVKAAFLDCITCLLRSSHIHPLQASTSVQLCMTVVWL